MMVNDFTVLLFYGFLGLRTLSSLYIFSNFCHWFSGVTYFKEQLFFINFFDGIRHKTNVTFFKVAYDVIHLLRKI